MARKTKALLWDQVVDTQTARDRIRELLEIADKFYPEPIQDVFISEYREQDGRQIVASVWVFTKSIVGEFKNALQEDNFDLVAYPKAVTYVEVTKKDFGLADWNDDSKLSVNFRFASGVSGSSQATRANCVEWLRMIHKYLVPNIVASPQASAVGLPLFVDVALP